MVCEACCRGIIWLLSPKVTRDGKPLDSGYMNHHQDVFQLKHAALTERCYICLFFWSGLSPEAQAIEKSAENLSYTTSYGIYDDMSEAGPELKNILLGVQSIYRPTPSADYIPGESSSVFKFKRLAGEIGLLI
jgi:hypothetical protein